MNETNSGTSVGLFSMIPGLAPEGDSLLSNLLANGERKEDFSSMQFNSAVIESFLKQHSLATSVSSPPQAVADGIVPEINAGNKTQQAYQAPPPPIPVVQQNMDTATSSRKRKPDDPQLAQTTGEQTAIPVSDMSRELSADEKLLMKKQRRLVKNREAAQLFRQRQKEYISNLEMKAAELTNANTEANARVELLASENKLMKEQLVYLRNFMKQAVAYSFPYSSMPIPQTSTPTSSPQLSPTMNPPLGNSFLDIEYPDIRIRGDIAGLGSSNSGTRQAIITTADGTSMNVNMGVLGAGVPLPVSSFPVSLMPMPVMASAATVPTMHGLVQQQIPQPQQQQTPSGVGIVPNRDDKDLLPD